MAQEHGKPMVHSRFFGQAMLINQVKDGALRRLAKEQGSPSMRFPPHTHNPLNPACSPGRLGLVQDDKAGRHSSTTRTGLGLGGRSTPESLGTCDGRVGR